MDEFPWFHGPKVLFIVYAASVQKRSFYPPPGVLLLS